MRRGSKISTVRRKRRRKDTHTRKRKITTVSHTEKQSRRRKFRNQSGD